MGMKTGTLTFEGVTIPLADVEFGVTMHDVPTLWARLRFDTMDAAAGRLWVTLRRLAQPYHDPMMDQLPAEEFRAAARVVKRIGELGVGSDSVDLIGEHGDLVRSLSTRDTRLSAQITVDASINGDQYVISIGVPGECIFELGIVLHG